MALPLHIAARARPAREQSSPHGVITPLLGMRSRRPRCLSSGLQPRAVEQNLFPEDFVVIPFNAEESWSEESEKLMESLVRRFKAADKDGNGVIDREELRDLLERVGDGDEPVPMHWLSDEDIEAVWARYDKDKNGVISFDEFVVMAQDGVFLRGQLAEYQEAFNAVDTGGNGSVGATELYQLFQKLGSPISYEKLVQVFDKYDANDSGVIDFPEFLRMFRDELLDLNEILAYIQGKGQAAKAPPLKEGGVTTVFSEKDFRAVLAAHPDKLVVLMATLTWCRPCKAFSSSFEKAAEHYSGSCIFLKLFGNSNDSTKELFKEKLLVRSTPTFFFFRNRALVGQCQGARGPRLEHHLRSHLTEGERHKELCFAPYRPEDDSKASD